MRPPRGAQVSWYMHGFMESLIVDASRNDFVVMLVHHVLAVCLIAGAYCGNAHRVALAVVCEQDVSDILLYISKMIQKSAAVPLFQVRAPSSLRNSSDEETILIHVCPHILSAGNDTPWGNTPSPCLLIIPPIFPSL